MESRYAARTPTREQRTCAYYWRPFPEQRIIHHSVITVVVTKPENLDLDGRWMRTYRPRKLSLMLKVTERLFFASDGTRPVRYHFGYCDPHTYCVEVIWVLNSSCIQSAIDS